MSVFGALDPFKACVISRDGYHLDPGPDDEHEAARCARTLNTLVNNQRKDVKDEAKSHSDPDRHERSGHVPRHSEPVISGAPHHLPAALKAHEFKNKPGDQRHHYPDQVNFAGHDVTFRHG
jgi:hypothetical protein